MDSERPPAGALVPDEDGDVAGVRVVDARHAGAAFGPLRVSDAELLRCDLSGADLSESQWWRVTLVDCRLSSVELPQAVLQDVTFRDCRLEGANLRLATLRRVRFGDSVLTGAELAAARLDDVAFPGSDLARAEISGARCRAVDLRGARLDGLRGVASLAGATVAPEQLVGLAPGLARALGVEVRPADSA